MDLRITRRRALAGAIAAAALAFGGSAAITAAAGASTLARSSGSVSFRLIKSPGIAACLPHARGRVTITPGSLNDVMHVTIHGMPARSGFDLFVIQLPLKPFGVAWYQTDVRTDRTGTGSATVRGVFDRQTFSVSVGGPTVAFPPTHQYHLGLWFNNPNVPFRLGCEPGATSPIITPFNGEQHAGIQVLNTAQFPVAAGPLSRVHR